MSAFLDSSQAVQLLRSAVATASGSSTAPPPEVVTWLARLRLLHGVPFAYLAVDAELLPPESIRFFYLDRNWTDAAVDGALSVAASVRERAHLGVRYQAVRQAVDVAERNVLHTEVHPDQTLGGSRAEVVTGFLLRSRVVSGWPGLRVTARRADEVRQLRVERLAPAVLLVLFDGVPDRVIIEEPRQGLQLGFDLVAGAFEVPTNPAPEPVRFRPGSPGVVDLVDLASRVAPASSAELGLRLMQFPFSQEFSGTPGEPVFQPSITLTQLDNAFGDQP